MEFLKKVLFIVLLSVILCKHDGKDEIIKKIKNDIVFRGFNLSNENTNTFLPLSNIFEKISDFHDQIQNKISANVNLKKLSTNNENFRDYFLKSNEFNFDLIDDNLNNQEDLSYKKFGQNDEFKDIDQWERRDTHERRDRDREREKHRERDRDHRHHHHRHNKFLFVNIFHNKPMNVIFFILVLATLIGLITFLSIKIVKKCKKNKRVIPNDENISNVNRSLENPNSITNINEIDNKSNDDKETITPYIESNNDYVDINRYSIKEALNNDF